MSRKCCVPNCESKSMFPSHWFPKNSIVSEKWKDAICSPIIDNLTVEERIKYKVCHLHFTESAYMCSSQRRRLKLDAVPSEKIPNKCNMVSCEKTDAFESFPSTSSTGNVIMSEEADTMEPLPSTSGIRNEIIVNTDLISHVNETEEDTSNVHRTKPQRSLLGATTRKRNLSDTAKRLYEKCKQLKKNNTCLKQQKATYKQRLNDARRLIFSEYGERLAQKLTLNQRLFIEMHLRYAQYKPRVNLHDIHNIIRKTLGSRSLLYLKK